MDEDRARKIGRLSGIGLGLVAVHYRLSEGRLLSLIQIVTECTPSEAGEALELLKANKQVKGKAEHGHWSYTL